MALVSVVYRITQSPCLTTISLVVLVSFILSRLGQTIVEWHQMVSLSIHNICYVNASLSSKLGTLNQTFVNTSSCRKFRRSLIKPNCESRQPSVSAVKLSTGSQQVQTSPPPLNNVAVILLAGGSGSRMKADRPKQFLKLRGRTILEHSIELFGQLPEVKLLIIVLASEFRSQFDPIINDLPCEVQFADPGDERQDSVYNGLALVSNSMSLVCVHDSARPLVTVQSIRNVLRDAALHGAAVLGVPSKATIKESADGQFVLRTIPRQRLWEIQTPQVIKPDLLRHGFEKVVANDLAVTDDVSIVEQLGEPVKLTLGEYTNIKITTPEDMTIAESILEDRH